MQVQSIGTGYFANTNSINKIKKTNISFGGNGFNKYDAALSLYEQKKEVERQKRHLESLEIEERNSIFYPTRRQVEEARKELRQKEISLKNKEREYESYNPSRYDFIDDVEKGRKQREERMKDYTSDGGEGVSVWDATGTSPGDWPFYCP